MYLTPTVLLLVAVIKVRCMVSQLRNKSFLQKEKLILLHTILFSLYVTVFTSALIASHLTVSGEDF